MHREIKDRLFAEFARMGKAVSSPRRIELLDLLAQGERTVERIAEETELTVKNASAHLQALKRARLVETRREGTRVFYRLASQDVFRFLRALQGLGRERLAEADRIISLFYEDPTGLEPVDAAELRRRLDEGGVVVLDVRPRDEYLAGHLPGAISIPVEELERRLAELPGSGEIVAYCRGPYCLFSGEAVELLRRHGFRARRLAPGLPDWRAQGFPVAVGNDS